MSVTPEKAEKVGPAYSKEALRAVQRDTIKALHEIAAAFRPGMRESEAYTLAKKMLEERGFEKSWHRPYVRFGKNTTKMYGQKSDENFELQENDIFYLDIGPVKNGMEGDAGDTFLTGENPQMQRCIDDTRKLFKECVTLWQNDRVSGKALYEFASSWAKERGWIFNHEWSGHRVSEFPHQLHYKGDLAGISFTPTSGLWILEIHLCDQNDRFGAFYEDLL